MLTMMSKLTIKSFKSTKLKAEFNRCIKRYEENLLEMNLPNFLESTSILKTNLLKSYR